MRISLSWSKIQLFCSWKIWKNLSRKLYSNTRISNLFLCLCSLNKIQEKCKIPSQGAAPTDVFLRPSTCWGAEMVQGPVQVFVVHFHLLRALKRMSAASPPFPEKHQYLWHSVLLKCAPFGITVNFNGDGGGWRGIFWGMKQSCIF